jgi:hypothetical protein
LARQVRDCGSAKRTGKKLNLEASPMIKVIASCGFALVLLASLAFEASAQSSCSGWYPICQKRCVAQGISCGHCDDLLATCRSTGCWTEGKNYGSRRHCNLKKS